MMLFLSLVLLFSQHATAMTSLIRPLSDTLQINSTLFPNGTLSSPPRPSDPFRLTNFYVHPPIAVGFNSYGAFTPRGVADVCLSRALDDAISNHSHSLLDPIDVHDLDYAVNRVSLSFHRIGMAIWEEWKNALYLILKFVNQFETREFFFTVEIFDYIEWYMIGQGSLVNF